MSANQDHEGVPRAFPTAALKALEPCAEGFWMVTALDQTTGAFTMNYFMKDGSHVATCTMRACTSEKEIRQQCANHLYKVPPTMPNNNNSKVKQNEPSATFAIPTHDELNANPPVPDQQAYLNSTAPDAFQTSQSLGDLAPAASFRSAVPAIPDQFAAQTPSVSRFSDQQGMPHAQDHPQSGFTSNQTISEKTQPMASPSGGYPALDTHNSMEMDWGYAETALPPSINSYIKQQDASNMGGHFEDTAHFYEDPFNPTMTGDLWTQFDMRDHVDNMFSTP